MSFGCEDTLPGLTFPERPDPYDDEPPTVPMQRVSKRAAALVALLLAIVATVGVTSRARADALTTTHATTVDPAAVAPPPANRR